MPRLLTVLISVLALAFPQAGLAMSAPSQAAATALAPCPGGVMSANVTCVGYLPMESPAVSARVVRVGAQTRLYVSNFKGLTIYDVTNPAAPVELGRLALPHAQNEDMEVSADGSRAIISADGGFLVPLFLGTGIHVIDTSNPANPVKVGFHADSNHTSTCADAACSVLYGSEGSTYQISADGKTVTKASVGWQQYIASSANQAIRCSLTQGAHDMNRDATGLISTDTLPRCILDPKANPLKPVVVAKSGPIPSSKNIQYQHNSQRPDAEQWVPRDPASPDYNDPRLRPGELLIGNGETNVVPRCTGTQGPIATWSMRNYDQGASMQVLETFRPTVNGNYVDGNPAVNVLGCSGHYFDERDNILAAAWFEHGTRFIQVDPTNGKMKEVGYFQPVVGSAGAAYWINDEYVYVTDYERGVDILRFNRNAAPPSEQELSASWLANLDVQSPAASAERYACRQSVGSLTVG